MTKLDKFEGNLPKLKRPEIKPINVFEKQTSVETMETDRQIPKDTKDLDRYATYLPRDLIKKIKGYALANDMKDFQVLIKWVFDGMDR